MTSAPPSKRPPADPAAWFDRPVLTGRYVTLRPMARADTDAYLAAAGTADDAAAVFEWLNCGPTPTREPRTRADAEVHMDRLLDAAARRERMAYAQIDTVSGVFIGTTSYYDIVPAVRTLAIGHTWLGKPWWRGGHNTEAKLLLLTRAFDDLGAARVVWHTDIHNQRSQAAIARLGATREGVLRKHRIRWDGSWRDTVQYSMTDDDWPEVRYRLTERLATAEAR